MTDVPVLLSSPVNFAVIQLPLRKYPGVVVQGDTLLGIVTTLSRMQKLLTKGDLEELRVEIDSMEEEFSEVLKHYRKICAEHSIT